MKKIIAIMICVFTLAALIACDGEPADTSDGGSGTNNSAQTGDNKGNDGNTGDDGDGSNAEKAVFVYNGVTIEMNALADPVIAALGEPKSTYESPSCAFQGNDIYYNYGSFEVSVYENNGERRIYSLFVKDDLVSTPEGLYIGSTESDAFAVYGEDSKTDSGNIIYHGNGVDVTVIFTDGKVSSIEYVATFG